MFGPTWTCSNVGVPTRSHALSTKILSSIPLRPGPRSPAIASPIPLLSALASGSNLLAHLVVESEMLGLVDATLLAAQAYRAGSTFSGVLLEGYYQELGQSVSDFERFRRTIRQQLCECLYGTAASSEPGSRSVHPGSANVAVPLDPVVLSVSASPLQGSTVAQNTSSPVAAHVRHRYLGIWGLKMIAAAADLLDHLITGAPPLSTMPGVLVAPIYLLIAGYKSWRLGEVLNNMNPPRAAPDLETVARMLRQSHANAEHILSPIASMRVQISEAEVRRDRVPPHNPFVASNGFHHDAFRAPTLSAPSFLPGHDRSSNRLDRRVCMATWARPRLAGGNTAESASLVTGLTRVDQPVLGIGQRTCCQRDLQLSSVEFFRGGISLGRTCLSSSVHCNDITM